MSKVSIFSFSALLLLLWGCSTTNHATLPTQAYHDITAHYNAYFNANEKIKYTLQTAEASHKDKFDSVIPVYANSNPADFTSYGSDLDDAVKRSTKSIQYHGLSNWSDDNMLLIGKAHYLKGEYDKAASSFKFITTEYKEGVDYVKERKRAGKKLGKYVKKKKKKKKKQPEVVFVKQKDGTKVAVKNDIRPKYTLFVHEPARAEALIWLANTYTRQGKYDEASSVITYIRNDNTFYKNLDPKVELADADIHVAAGNYGMAIAPLEKHIDSKGIRKNKKKRVRPLFVLAQCYEATGNNKKAIDNYKLVLKSRPNYDMEFYAKLKMAKLGRGGSNAGIKQLLAKMSRDGKYKEYWDQIFYELALISIQETNLAEARKYLQKSVDNSTSNEDQKALSYLKFAELDYDEANYVRSKYYYDSTTTSMARNDPRYVEVELRSKMLTSLVDQLNIIAYEDSMQKLAAMSPEAREVVIREAVAKLDLIEEEKRQKELADQQAQQMQGFQNNNTSSQTQSSQTQSSGSTWYFYNTAARTTGYNDFVKKWGRRKLEENWRRKNKSVGITDDDVVVGTGVDSMATKLDEKQAKADEKKGTPEEQLRANIPNTPEQITASADRLVDAYYAAGTIYKDGLENYPKATDMFEALNNRMAKHKLLLESYYQLYLIAMKTGDKANAEKYKALILSQFPESVIAKVLKDPNFVNASRQQEIALNNYYEETYNDFANNRLDSAWYKAKMSNTLFKPNPYAAKFDLLLALILSKQNRLGDYVQALQKLTTSSDSEVKRTASNLLAGLNQSSLPQIDLSQDTTMRDSLNAKYGLSMQQQANITSASNNTAKGTETTKAKDAAVTEYVSAGTAATAGNSVPKAAGDTATKAATITDNGTKVDSTAGAANANATGAGTKVDSVAGVGAPTPEPVVMEDTTSPYTRSDASVHYVIIYIKDPTTPQPAIMSTMAKVDAFNSTQFELKRLVSKQVIIDSKNKLLNIRQFKNKEDVMEYLNVMRRQGQLFSDLKPEQYAVVAISTINFATLLSLKDIDEYDKFFKRVYK